MNCSGEGNCQTGELLSIKKTFEVSFFMDKIHLPKGWRTTKRRFIECCWQNNLILTWSLKQQVIYENCWHQRNFIPVQASCWMITHNSNDLWSNIITNKVNTIYILQMASLWINAFKVFLKVLQGWKIWRINQSTTFSWYTQFYILPYVVCVAFSAGSHWYLSLRNL